MGQSRMIKRRQRPSFRILSLNPDLEDEFGHFLHHDRVVRRHAVAKGGDLISLSHVRFSSAIPTWVSPTFRDNSWSLATGRKEHYTPRFARELENGICNI